MKETILELEARVQKLEAMYSAIQNIALLRLNHIPFTDGIEHPTEAFCPLWHLDGFKIIGNIYQDKELLNG